MADGLLVLDKPAGLTSHAVVARTRKIMGTRKVGHAGTLDPMATGVLVLGVDRGTKLLTYLVGVDKTYHATIRLGAATTTDDAEGEISMVAGTASVQGVTDAAIASHIAPLTGEIDQIPSAVSAIKVDGKRAHALVRAGEQVDLAPRRVTVSRFDVIAVRRLMGQARIEGPDETGQTVEFIDLDVEVDCSSGTYIRALARDLGRALGVGGHLTALRRTKVGPFGIERAVGLEQLADDPACALISLGEGAQRVMPVHEVTLEQAEDLRHGRRVFGLRAGEQPLAALGPDGALVAVLSRPEGRFSMTVFS